MDDRTTDRELLELAAKAAKIEGAWGAEGYFGGSEGFIPSGWRRAWNPLDRNEDALELAIKLRVSVIFGDRDDVEASISEPDDEYCKAFAMEPVGTDAPSAVRRAVVRAAASIGKAGGGETEAKNGR